MKINWLMGEDLYNDIKDEELVKNIIVELGKLKKFSNDTTEYLFMIEDEDNKSKIKEMYPKYYDRIINNFTDGSCYVDSFNGGETYRTSDNKEIAIGECIDLLNDKILDDDTKIIFELAKVFITKKISFGDLIEQLLKEQLTDVIYNHINKLQNEIKLIKNISNDKRVWS